MSTTGMQNPDPATTVGELRKQYGRHFAIGYGDEDPIGKVLAFAGVATLEEYLGQQPPAQRG